MDQANKTETMVTDQLTTQPGQIAEIGAASQQRPGCDRTRHIQDLPATQSTPALDTLQQALD